MIESLSNMSLFGYLRLKFSSILKIFVIFS